MLENACPVQCFRCVHECRAAVRQMLQLGKSSRLFWCEVRCLSGTLQLMMNQIRRMLQQAHINLSGSIGSKSKLGVRCTDGNTVTMELLSVPNEGQLRLEEVKRIFRRRALMKAVVAREHCMITLVRENAWMLGHDIVYLDTYFVIPSRSVSTKTIKNKTYM